MIPEIICDGPSVSGYAPGGRFVEATATAATFPSAAGAGPAGVAAVGRAGTVVLYPFEGETLHAASAVAVGGPGRPRAVLLPGALPVGDAAGVCWWTGAAGPGNP
jgi:hypothetical protein